MTKRTTYRVKEGAGAYVAGRRVKPGLEMELSEEQARYPLIAGEIELAERKAAVSDPEGRKARRKSDPSEA